MRPVRPWGRLKKTVLYYATHYTWTFAVIMTVTLASCFFSIHYLATLEADLKDIYENDVKGGDAVQAAYTALLGLESSAKDLVLFTDRRTQVRARADIKARTAALRASMNAATPRFYTPRAKQALLSAQGDLKEFLSVLQSFLAIYDAGRPVDQKALLRLQEKSHVLQKDFDLLVANRIANSSLGVKDLVGQLRWSLIVTVVILVVTMGVRIVLWIAGHPRFNRTGSRRGRET